MFENGCRRIPSSHGARHPLATGWEERERSRLWFCGGNVGSDPLETEEGDECSTVSGMEGCPIETGRCRMVKIPPLGGGDDGVQALVGVTWWCMGCLDDSGSGSGCIWVISGRSSLACSLMTGFGILRVTACVLVVGPMPPVHFTWEADNAISYPF